MVGGNVIGALRPGVEKVSLRSRELYKRYP